MFLKSAHKIVSTLQSLHCQTLIYTLHISIALFTTTLSGQYAIYDTTATIYPLTQVNKKRLNIYLGITGTTYLAGSYVLYQTWYKDFPQSRFHFKDDLSNWLQMDKAGHAFSSYQQARLLSQGFQWTGLNMAQSDSYGVIAALLFQSTIEVMDGFSEQWGFSPTDAGANLLGVAIYGLQSKFWNDQRIILKFSAYPSPHNNIGWTENMDQIDLMARANILFGNGIAQRSLKDYNNQRYWLSMNVNSLTHLTMPSWLNIAVGYGADNLYGASSNTWEENTQIVQLHSTLFPRSRQFYLSLDIDTSRINTNNRFLRTLLDLINIIKIPFPTLEYHTSQGLIFHPLKF